MQERSLPVPQCQVPKEYRVFQASLQTFPEIKTTVRENYQKDIHSKKGAAIKNLLKFLHNEILR